MRLARVLPLLTVATLVAACDAETTTTPQVDVDATLEQMTSSGISTFAAAAVQAGGTFGVSLPTVTPPASHSSSCSFDNSSQFFVCAPVTTIAITFSRSFQLLDGSGAPLSSPNPTALASIRSVVDIQGTIPGTAQNPTTAEIARHEDATLSGIRAERRVLNGNSTQRLAVSGANFGFVSNDTSATTNLELPLASSAQKWPLGGKIVTNRSVSFSSPVIASHRQQEEISFDGTSVMTVKITTATAVMTCKINLATPGVAPVCL